MPQESAEDTLDLMADSLPAPTEGASVAKTVIDLERRLAELTCLHEGLLDAVRRKDEFLATLAHELRNPLAPLLSALQLMELSPEDVDQVKNLRVIMARQLEQLMRLTDDLLDISRVTRGKLTLQKEYVDLASAIEAACDLSRPLMDEAGHSFTRTLPPGPLVVLGDKVRLAQVVGNLLINAAKYTPPGGRIDLLVCREEGQAEIRIKDTGVGIPAGMLPRVFDLFTQVRESKVRSQGGLGIGLALARRLVEMHGGSIGVTSGGEGLGSEFVVRLPLARHAPAAVHSPVAVPEASLQLPAYRILIVDDNVAPAHLLSRLLLKLGQHAYTVSSAAAALEAVGKTKPDIIMSDIGMPEMSGYDLAARIRGTSSLRDVVLVAVTGYGQESDREQALAAGFEYHLTKPVGLKDLEKLLTCVAEKQKK